MSTRSKPDRTRRPDKTIEVSVDDGAQQTETDPLLRLRGSGKHLWADEHADEYIKRLREDWPGGGPQR